MNIKDLVDAAHKANDAIFQLLHAAHDVRDAKLQDAKQAFMVAVSDLKEVLEDLEKGL